MTALAKASASGLEPELTTGAIEPAQRTARVDKRRRVSSNGSAVRRMSAMRRYASLWMGQFDSRFTGFALVVRTTPTLRRSWPPSNGFALARSTERSVFRRYIFGSVAMSAWHVCDHCDAAVRK